MLVEEVTKEMGLYAARSASIPNACFIGNLTGPTCLEICCNLEGNSSLINLVTYDGGTTKIVIDLNDPNAIDKIKEAIVLLIGKRKEWMEEVPK